MFIKIYGRQNALVLKECYAHLRVLLYTFSKECCSLYRRMLHRGMPQLPQEMPHSFKFSTITYEKHAVLLEQKWLLLLLPAAAAVLTKTRPHGPAGRGNTVAPKDELVREFHPKSL